MNMNIPIKCSTCGSDIVLVSSPTDIPKECVLITHSTCPACDYGASFVLETLWDKNLNTLDYVEKQDNIDEVLESFKI